jgi:GNAT superfamily N-acetyltransferase
MRRNDDVMPVLVVAKATDLPEDLGFLLRESEANGFRFLARMQEEWRSGANRFSLPGEALFEARQGGRLAGICGLNVDPYAGDDSVGRLRRMYVLRDARRSGVGTALVNAAVAHARGRFKVVRLRTNSDAAAAFYIGLGFRRSDGAGPSTHEIALG